MAQWLNADARPACLRGGGVDRADREVVAVLGQRTVNLGEGVRRPAHEAVRAHQRTSLVGWRVILTDVHTVGIDLGGELRIVVHDEQRVMAARDLTKDPGGGLQLWTARRLVTELDKVHARADHLVEEHLKVTLLGAPIHAEVEPRARESPTAPLASQISPSLPGAPRWNEPDVWAGEGLPAPLRRVGAPQGMHRDEDRSHHQEPEDERSGPPDHHCKCQARLQPVDDHADDRDHTKDRGSPAEPGCQGAEVDQTRLITPAMLIGSAAHTRSTAMQLTSVPPPSG